MAVRIGVGLASFPFRAADGFWRWVEYCERSAIDSLWQTDRLVSGPAFLEAMCTMAALAGATRRIKFGMNAVVVSFRDPLLLAKQCATIDMLSGGRLLPVFGVGRDDAAEWRASGRARQDRGTRANEALELMQQLWTREHVTFEGRHYQFHDVTIAPRPVQAPLPLWIGGASEAAVRRTARLGTGWLAGVQTPAEVGSVIAAIRAECARVGRAIPEDHYGASLAFRFGSSDDPAVARFLAARAPRTAVAAQDAGSSRDERVAVGSSRDILDRLQAYRAVGATKFVLIPIASSDDDVLEQTRRLAEEVVPSAHAWD
jgi:probable F420-dependent oxidoreductase